MKTSHIPSLRAGLLAASAAIAFTAAASAEDYSSDHHDVTVDTIADGLDHPWAIALLPDGRYLVTERNSGDLRIGDVEGGLSEPVENVPEIFRYEGETGRSQAGLFDVKLHPDFAENQLIYLSFSEPTSHGASASVVRAQLVEDAESGSASLEDVETVFRMKEADQDSSGLHFGGRLAIHPDDGSIFYAIGDRRDIGRSQDTDDQAGSILRFTADGEAHSDNPFAGDEEGDAYIYSYGHRNNQGLAFDSDGQLWANEHGPEGGDMIQRIEAGNNYGWPFLTAGVDYSGAPIGVGTEHEGMQTAFHYFEDTLGPSGAVFYSGDAFAEWEGDLLNGALYPEHIVRVRLGEDGVETEEWMFEGIGRVRDIQIAEDGSLWLVTDESNGRVLHVRPAD